MKKPAAILAALAVISMFLFDCSAQAASGRAISLKMLEKVLKDGSSRQALTLYGVTHVSGFVVDTGSKDIILIGRVDSARPALHADDFIVALRAANMLYARREGNVRYFSPPGCSIDPDPETIRQLQRVGRGPDGRWNDIRSSASAWEQIGRRPQKVRVMGVPLDTRFAKVMVDADYYMKRLSNGSVHLGIPGFDSLTSMRVEDVRAALRSGAESAEPESSLNRFWFCPGEVSYEESDGAVILRECRVVLLTEEEYLSAVGEVKGLGRSSTYAARFADAFTEHYQSIAAARPIYRELESLFRFCAIANLMADTRAASRAGLKMSHLLSGHRVKTVPVSRAVSGQTHVVELTDETETEYGAIVRRVLLMSCGGVNMDVRPKKLAPAAPATGGKTAKPQLRSTRKAVITSRPSSSAVYWDYVLPD